MRKKIKAQIMWAFLERQHELSDKYQLDLTNLSDKAVEALEEMGITANFKDDKGHYITCKSTRPIHASGVDGDSLRDVKIGNGTLCTAVISPYSWTFKNKSGVSPNISNLVITDLVEYEDDDGGDDGYDDDEPAL